MIINLVKSSIRLFLLLMVAGSFSVYSQSIDKRCRSVTMLKDSSPMNSKGELKARMLKAHNAIREIYDLPDLAWSPKLAKYAQQWAEELKAKKKCQLMHRTQRSYGENIAMNWTSKKLSKTQFDKSPEYAVQNWAGECKDYSHGSYKCKSGKVCGHFTQVAWEDSEKVGCGMVSCDGKENAYGQGRVELWVCNYDPPGNYIGEEPF